MVLGADSGTFFWEVFPRLVIFNFFLIYFFYCFVCLLVVAITSRKPIMQQKEMKMFLL